MQPKAVLRAGVIVAALVLGAPAPTGAIETATFGIDVVEPTSDGRLHIGVAAGETSTGVLRAWNKTSEPITLRLSVAPAEVGPSGTSSLGGEEPAVAWVELEPSRVELGPSATATIRVVVDAPRRISDEVRTVAVVAEPALEAGATASVVQRLAVTTYLEPDSGSLVASLGVWLWLAVLLLAAVVVAFAVDRRRSRA